MQTTLKQTAQHCRGVVTVQRVGAHPRAGRPCARKEKLVCDPCGGQGCTPLGPRTTHERTGTDDIAANMGVGGWTTSQPLQPCKGGTGRHCRTRRRAYHGDGRGWTPPPQPTTKRFDMRTLYAPQGMLDRRWPFPAPTPDNPPRQPPSLSHTQRRHLSASNCQAPPSTARGTTFLTAGPTTRRHGAVAIHTVRLHQ